jgi:uncharacterized RDD family membrane protein YckC
MSFDPEHYKPPNANLDNPSSTEPVLAPRLIRLLASMIDGMIYMFLAMPVAYQLGYFDNPFREPSWTDAVTSVLLGVCAVVLVNGYLLATRGQSVGKLMLGIQIVGMDGKLLPLAKIVFVRFLPIQALSQIPVPGLQGLAALVDALMIFRPDRRCLHDHLAGTRVIYKQD